MFIFQFSRARSRPRMFWLHLKNANSHFCVWESRQAQKIWAWNSSVFIRHYIMSARAACRKFQTPFTLGFFLHDIFASLHNRNISKCWLDEITDLERSKNCLRVSEFKNLHNRIAWKTLIVLLRGLLYFGGPLFLFALRVRFMLWLVLLNEFQMRSVIWLLCTSFLATTPAVFSVFEIGFVAAWDWKRKSPAVAFVDATGRCKIPSHASRAYRVVSSQLSVRTFPSIVCCL